MSIGSSSGSQEFREPRGKSYLPISFSPRAEDVLMNRVKLVMSIHESIAAAPSPLQLFLTRVHPCPSPAIKAVAAINGTSFQVSLLQSHTSETGASGGRGQRCYSSTCQKTPRTSFWNLLSSFLLFFSYQACGLHFC